MFYVGAVLVMYEFYYLFFDYLYIFNKLLKLLRKIITMKEIGTKFSLIVPNNSLFYLQMCHEA